MWHSVKNWGHVENVLCSHKAVNSPYCFTGNSWADILVEMMLKYMKCCVLYSGFFCDAPGLNPHFSISQILTQNKTVKGQHEPWPIHGSDYDRTSSQRLVVTVTDLRKWEEQSNMQEATTTNDCCFVLPDSLQKRFTRPVTPLWSSSTLTIQSTRKVFTSATPAPSSRTHCTHASDQRGPEGAVQGKGANGGEPRGGASLMLGNLRPTRCIRHDRTAARPPTAPQLLGALAPPTDCEE